MTFYIGVDLHPYQQTLCWCDGETGETGSLKLTHDIEKVREYYSSIGQSAVIGIEASSKAGWFERIVEGGTDRDALYQRARINFN